MKKNAESNPTAVFNQYSRLVKEKYGMLEYKNIDVDHLTDSLSAFVNEELSEDSLFGILNVYVQQLKDGHTDLVEYNDAGEIERLSIYNFLAGYPMGFHAQILIDNYVGNEVAPLISELRADGELKAFYGKLPQNNEVGYIFIPSFNVDLSTEEIEMIFAEVNDTKGLIFDIRTNTGGNPALATVMGSYLLSEPTYIGYEKFKTGPGEDDFSTSQATVTPPESEYRYNQPVMVLTDRYVYSAATTFCYTVSPSDKVTFVGQRTGGGSGSIADGYLGNGWQWTMSVSEFVGLDNEGNELNLDNGFEPDIAVELDTLDKSKDEVIERALLELD